MIKIPPERVLVAVDMSEESMIAWEHGVSLRRHFGCVVEAAFVTTDPQVPRLRRAELTRALRERIGEHEKVVVDWGDPVLTLSRMAKSRRADLLILGPHHRSPVDRILNGSVTETLIRQSPIPVLAVHGRPRTISRVLAPVSDKPYSEAGLVVAAAVAAAFKARLDALRVLPVDKPGATPLAHLAALIHKLPEKVRTLCTPQADVRFGRIEDEIWEAAQSSQLIVMTAHRKRFLQDMLHNMTAVKVIRQSTVPVLIIPEPESRFVTPRWKDRPAVHTA